MYLYRFLTFILLYCVVFILNYTYSFDWKNNCEEKKFVVTAYYSPQDNQNFYYKKDYKQEVILNGEGKYGASGKAVFNGMLAAPKTYSFGGKIYFPDLGVGEISDRGGAIVAAGERDFQYDRIDVWMGYGEEGLIRALTFGKKTLTGYFCDKNSIDKLKLNKKEMNVGINFEKIPVFKNFFDIAIWLQELYPDRSDVWVWTLQKYLIKLGYLKSDKHTGYFGQETKKALCKYQIDKKIITKNHVDCGVYGSKTRYKMKKDVESKGLFPDNLREIGSFEHIKNKSTSWDDAQQIIDNVININEYFDKPFVRGKFDGKVFKLQELLVWLNLYDGEINGIYDNKTINAVYEFQIKEGLLVGFENNSNVWGYMGPSTRRSLNAKNIERENAKKIEKLESIMSKDNDSIKTKNDIKNTFKFYRSYSKGEGPNEEIRILQRFLQKQGFYDGKINGIYDNKTINSVFQFQQHNGILSKNDSLYLQGYLGPKTRDFINKNI